MVVVVVVVIIRRRRRRRSSSSSISVIVISGFLPRLQFYHVRQKILDAWSETIG